MHPWLRSLNDEHRAAIKGRYSDDLIESKFVTRFEKAWYEAEFSVKYTTVSAGPSKQDMEKTLRRLNEEFDQKFEVLMETLRIYYKRAKSEPDLHTKVVLELIQFCRSTKMILSCFSPSKHSLSVIHQEALCRRGKDAVKCPLGLLFAGRITEQP